MKKNHWHAFWHEKLFEKHPQPHCQTRSQSSWVSKKTKKPIKIKKITEKTEL